MGAPVRTGGAGRLANSDFRFFRPMADPNQWAFPSSLQPQAVDLRFDLAAAMNAVVALRAEVPEDAFTASILGTERTGNGVVIGDDGLVLTVGYLITEAETIWLTSNDGRVVPATPLAYDFATGFGLVQPLARLDLPPLAMAKPGAVAALDDGSEVYALGHGGRAHALAARVFAKREFAGYWEYLLDEALFTRPPHPEWSGAALVDEDGVLVGLGSLFVQERDGDDEIKGNMFVPVELLTPILDELRRFGGRRDARAAVARRLHRRGRRAADRPGRRHRRSRRPRRRAARRRRGRGLRRAGDARCPSSTAPSGARGPPASRCRWCSPAAGHRGRWNSAPPTADRS